MGAQLTLLAAVCRDIFLDDLYFCVRLDVLCRVCVNRGTRCHDQIVTFLFRRALFERS